MNFLRHLKLVLTGTALLVFGTLFMSCASSNSPWGKVSSGVFDPDSIHIDDPSIPARVLMDLGEMNIGRGTFELTLKEYVRIQVFREAGMKYANVRIPFYGDEHVSHIKAQTILPTGEKIKLKRGDIFTEGEKGGSQFKVFAIPGVQEECVIEYSYKRSSEYLRLIDPWRFQKEIPTKYSRISVTLPEGFEYQSFIQNAPANSYKPDVEKYNEPNNHFSVKYT